MNDTDEKPQAISDMYAKLQEAGYSPTDLRNMTPSERDEAIRDAISKTALPPGFEIESDDKYVEIDRPSDHPLEDFFDIEPGSTMVPYKERVPTELNPHESYDDKDNEIETQFQEIYEAAMEAYENSLDDSEDVEPKYQARAREVAAQFLNTALAAAKEKANVKSNKDKIHSKEKALTKTQNTTNIFVDRNELLRAMREEKEKVIDGTFEENEE